MSPIWPFFSLDKEIYLNHFNKKRGLSETQHFRRFPDPAQNLPASQNIREFLFLDPNSSLFSLWVVLRTPFVEQKKLPSFQPFHNFCSDPLKIDKKTHLPVLCLLPFQKHPRRFKIADPAPPHPCLR